MIEVWPPSAWAAVLTLGASALAWPANRLWLLFVRRSDRSASREDHALELVELLRRALDKGRVRENGIASACDMLTTALEIALGMIGDPPPAIAATRRRALDHLRAARELCREIERGTQ